MLESDSQILVKTLRSKEHNQALGGVLFREAKFLLSTLFSSVSVNFASRSCNMCAHELASLGFAWDPDLPGVWDDPLPEFVSTLVDRDHADPEFA